MIIDSHAHVLIPTENQISLMEEAGVEKTILFSTTPHTERAVKFSEFEQELNALNSILSGSISGNERLRRMELITDELCSVINAYPDMFLGFGNVPLFLSNENTCEWIQKKIIDNNLIGIGEISIPAGHTDLLENILQSLMDTKKMPVWIHTFHPLTLADIKNLAVLAKRYNNIPLIFGHMGGHNWLDTIKLAKEQKNIYLDLSAVYTTFAPKWAISEVPDRTLFSSDAPYGNPLLSRKMVELICPDETICEKVLGGNIIKLLEEYK